jgi:outer membrane biosynthesis protein TonB
MESLDTHRKCTRQRLHKEYVFVVIAWEDDIIGTIAVSHGCKFVLGDEPGAWPFPEQHLGASSVTVIDYTEEEPHTCANGEPLGRGQRISLDFGPFRITALRERADDTLLAAPPPSFEFRSWAYLAGVALLFGSIVSGIRHSEPGLAMDEAFAVPPEPEWPAGAFAHTSAEPELGEPVASVAERVFPDVRGIAGWARCGGEFDMGTVTVYENARYAVTGPKDNPDPHLSRTTPFRRKSNRYQTDFGRIAVVEQREPDTRAPQAPWGRDESLGTDEVSARGNMWGDDVYDATGAEESMGKTHLDGGKTKLVDTKRAIESTPARVFHTALDLQGPLSPAVVERALLRTLGKVRDCYRSDPASQGTREGRVDVQFYVDKNGQVQDARTINAHRLADETLACIRGHFAAVTFPPTATKTTVTYPLMMIPGARSEANTSERLAVAPDVQRPPHTFLPCAGRVRSRPIGSGCRR